MQTIRNILRSPVTSSLAGAGGNAAFWDWQNYDWDTDGWDKSRIGQAVLNALIGAGGGHLMHSGVSRIGNPKKFIEGLEGLNPSQIADQISKIRAAGAAEAVAGAGAITLSPVKDLVLTSIPAVRKLEEASEDTSAGINAAKLLGLGALGLGGIGIAKYLSQKDPKTEMGKLKLRVPGKEGEPDTAAEVELPIDMPEMSPSLLEGLGRGVRRQARKNVKANSFKRDPKTDKLIPYEVWEDKYGNKDREKAASTQPVLLSHIGYAGNMTVLGGVMREILPDVFSKEAGMVPPPPSPGPQQPPPPPPPADQLNRRPVLSSTQPAQQDRDSMNEEAATDRVRNTVNKAIAFMTSRRNNPPAQPPPSAPVNA